MKTTWFDTVTAEVDHALNALPACESCPHDVYRRVLELPHPTARRIAVVSDDNGPVAVIGLRKHSRLVWEPVTNWLFPGAAFPAREGMTIAALEALRLEIPMAWWRLPMPPPHGPRIRDLSIEPVYRLDNLATREEFWKSTDYLRHVKNIRNRARHLEVRVGATEIVEGVATGWREKWSNGGRADPEVQARVLLAQALEPIGRHITIGLFDDGKLAAGATNFVHNGAMVAGVLYVPDEYRRLSAGVRLIELVFEEAEKRGLSSFDLGGGADYKRKWAPPVGERARFTVAGPAHVRLMRGLAGMARKLRPGATPQPQEPPA